MQVPKVVTVAVVLWLASAPPSQSRLVAVPSYQELLAKSDLVVVATPLTKTVDTQERAFLPGIFRVDASGKKS